MKVIIKAHGNGNFTIKWDTELFTFGSLKAAQYFCHKHNLNY